MRKVLLLGASGSIGGQVLDVMKADKANFELVAFSVGEKIEKIPEILCDFPSVSMICVKKEEDMKSLRGKYQDVHILCGDEGLKDIVSFSECDMVVNALVGFCGLVPSLAALNENKILCLANKESLVVGGTLIKRILSEGKGKLIPIDSEHVSIAKMLARTPKEKVEKILITASGGALRNHPIESLEEATPKDVLRHPTWSMGPKITTDCATMMNKGFEVIEAAYLYDWPVEKIEVLMHDESHVHSCLQLKDGSIVADVSKPDMRNPIKWALYEGGIDYSLRKVHKLHELGDFTFHKFDPERYPSVDLCLEAFASKGNAPAILNAANEAAVAAFLEGKIPFTAIHRECKGALANVKWIANPSLRDLQSSDALARLYVNKHIERTY